MPSPAESLSSNSSDEQIQQAISSSIEQCMREGGREQDQCIAIAYEMARKATGRHLGRGSAATIRAGMEPKT